MNADVTKSDEIQEYVEAEELPSVSIHGGRREHDSMKGEMIIAGSYPQEVRLLRLSARLHLLWLVVEDSIRREINYSQNVADHWLASLEELSTTLGPLEEAVESGGEDRLQSTYAHAIIYIKDRTVETLGLLKDNRHDPVDRIYSTLAQVCRMRGALAMLFQLVLAHQRNRESVLDARGGLDVPHREGATSLRLAFERASSVLLVGDDQGKCQASRDLYLALFRSMTYDEIASRELYMPSMNLQAELQESMAPGAARGCVTDRIEVMKRIPPSLFESEAVKSAIQQ